MDALAFLTVLNPITVVVAAVVALPGALSVLHALLPFADVHFLIEPTELPVALSVAVGEAAAVDALACRFNAVGLEAFVEFAFIENPFTDKNTFSLSLSLHKLAKV